MEEKLRALLDRLKKCGSLAVALSGGVDSSTLAKAAALALGDKAVAITARSELLAQDELADAVATARAAGIRHIVLDVHDLDNPDVVKNGIFRSRIGTLISRSGKTVVIPDDNGNGSKVVLP